MPIWQYANSFIGRAVLQRFIPDLTLMTNP